MEDVVERTVCNRAEMDGWLVRKLRWIGRRAAPDRLFIKRGRVVFIEFKSPGLRPNALQLREIDRLKAAGVEVYVIDSIGEGLEVLGIE